MTENDAEKDVFFSKRYARHLVLKQIGPKQAHLQGHRALLVGVGSLGCAAADMLVRAGIGALKLVDKDVVEWPNLPHQLLYDESCIGMPKIEAAKQRLAQIDHGTRIDAYHAEVNSSNMEEFVRDVDIIIDGTDNMGTRHIINDAAVKNGIPYLYQGSIGVMGSVYLIIPGKTACLRCMLPELPGPGMPTPDSMGVLSTLPRSVSGLGMSHVLRYLLEGHYNGILYSIDLWDMKVDETKVLRRENCQCCGKRDFKYLD